METKDKFYYYHNDINGAPLRLTDEAGNIVWNAHYDIFGKIDKLSKNEIDNLIRMQGQYEDEETGLYYNRFRYYDPNISAYVSQDPLRLRAGINLYSYGVNSFGWIDPMGLSCEKEWKKKIIMCDKPHDNKTPGHWFGMKRKAVEMAKRDDVEKVYLNKGLSNEIPGIKPNRRPDVMVVKTDGKIDQFEVPSKTDVRSKLMERMDESRKLMGDRAGDISILDIL